MREEYNALIIDNERLARVTYRVVNSDGEALADGVGLDEASAIVEETEAETGERPDLIVEETAWTEANRILRGQGAPRFAEGRLIMPGGTNQREFYITLPKDKNAGIEAYLVPPGHRIGIAEADEFLVVRIRVSDYIDADGNKTIVIQEVQGDRQQAAREKGGFAERPDPAILHPLESELLEATARFEQVSLETLERVTGFKSLRELYRSASTQENPTEYKNKLMEDVNEARRVDKERFEAAEEALAKYQRSLSGPDPIPFPTSKEWTALALKRIAVKAVEEGYDAIGWTPGEVQADRYDLSQHLTELTVQPAFKAGTLKRLEGQYSIAGIKDGDTVLETVVKEEDLENTIGKDLADRAIKDIGAKIAAGDNLPWVQYSGLDLKVGGEGLKIFYDKIVVNVANKLGRLKTWGAKVGVASVDVRDADEVRHVDPEVIEKAVEEAKAAEEFDIAVLLAEARDAASSGMRPRTVFRNLSIEVLLRFLPEAVVTTKAQEIWSIPITDELRDTVQGPGLPLFQDRPDPFGAFSAADPRGVRIKLFESADLSTMLHESGHFFVHMLERLAQREDAPQSIKDNYAAMLNWVGATNADDLNVRINGDSARAKQEKLAEAFEVYLKEGKAPSAELKTAFAQFRDWLKRIYEQVVGRRLTVDIDDSIRQVFDRMLATDQQIAEMKAINEFDAGASPSIMNLMNTEERAAFQAAMQASDAATEDVVTAWTAAIMKRTEQDFWKAELEKAKRRVEKDLWTRPEYRALWFLTHGELKDEDTPAGIKGRRLDKQALLDAGLTKEDLKALPKIGGKAIYTTDEDTATDPEIMAAFLGFDSTQEMVDVFKAMLPAEKAIQNEAEMLMRSEHGDPLNDGTIEVLTEEALYNEERVAAIQTELDVLARAAGQTKVTRPIIKAVADEIYAAQQVGDLLTPMKYQAASVRAAKAAERAAANGDVQTAFIEKRKQMLNHELFRRGLKAREEVQKINKYLRNLQSRKIDPKKIDPDYVANIKNLLQFYEVGAVSLKKLLEEGGRVSAAEVMLFVEKQIASGSPVVLPGDLVEYIGEDAGGEAQYAFKVTHWRTMTLPELRGLRDMVKNLEHIGKMRSKNSKAADEAAGLLLAEGIMASTRPRKGKETKMARPSSEKLTEDSEKHGIYYEHRKLESLLRQLDGFQDLGPMWQAVFGKIADGRDWRTLMVQKVMADIDGSFGAYSRKERTIFKDPRSGVAIESLGGAHFDHEQRLMIAVNWGNEGSREALLNDTDFVEQFGEAWNEAAIQEILETLTTKDLDIVEGMWTAVNQFWEDVTLPNDEVILGIASLERKYTGVVPQKVEAVSFSVNGRLMPGAYFPLAYDGRISSRVAIEKQEDIAKMNRGGGFSHAQTRHNHTKERVGSGGRPVKLSISVFMSHLEDVIHDLAFREAVLDADKILTNADVRDAIVETMGQQGYNRMRDILLRVAQGNRPQDMGAGDRRLRSARLNVTSAIMGLNIRVIFTQWLGVFQSMERIGTPRMTQGLIEFWGNFGIVEEIHAQSTFMRERGKMLTRELDDIANTIELPTWSNSAKEWGFKPIVFADVYLVAYPTWLGAKRKALAGKVEGIAADDETAAIKYADMIVRTTQGAGGPENLSMIQQRSEGWKLMTMFGSYFNTTMNMQAEAIEKAALEGERGGVVAKARAGRNLIWATTMLSMFPAVFAGLMLENWPSDDDEDENGEFLTWTKWYLLQLANQMGAQVFILRDIVSSVTSGFGVSLTPVQSFFEAGIRGGKELLKIPEYYESGELPVKLAKSIVRFLGMWKGVPGTSSLIRFFDTTYKMTSEEVELKHPPRSKLEAAQKLILTGDR